MTSKEMCEMNTLSPETTNCCNIAHLLTVGTVGPESSKTRLSLPRNFLPFKKKRDTSALAHSGVGMSAP